MRFQNGQQKNDERFTPERSGNRAFRSQIRPQNGQQKNEERFPLLRVEIMHAGSKWTPKTPNQKMRSVPPKLTSVSPLVGVEIVHAGRK